MGNNTYIEEFSDSKKNTNIAAATSEGIASALADVKRHAPFNELVVDNGDDVDIEVRLDGVNVGGRVFIVRNHSVFGIQPEDGIFFNFVTQTNLHASTAETADKILFRWARKRRI